MTAWFPSLGLETVVPWETKERRQRLCLSIRNDCFLLHSLHKCLKLFLAPNLLLSTQLSLSVGKSLQVCANPSFVAPRHFIHFYQQLAFSNSLCVVTEIFLTAFMILPYFLALCSNGAVLVLTFPPQKCVFFSQI